MEKKQGDDREGVGVHGLVCILEGLRNAAKNKGKDMGQRRNRSGERMRTILTITMGADCVQPRVGWADDLWGVLCVTYPERREPGHCGCGCILDHCTRPLWGGTEANHCCTRALPLDARLLAVLKKGGGE